MRRRWRPRRNQNSIFCTHLSDMHLRIGVAMMSLLMVVIGALALRPVPAHSQSDGTPILGYAWSDTVGWLDLNCQNSNVCTTDDFGFTLFSDGTIGGYAWSENIGW